jgi:hypothetical protein
MLAPGGVLVVQHVDVGGLAVLELQWDDLGLEPAVADRRIDLDEVEGELAKGSKLSGLIRKAGDDDLVIVGLGGREDDLGIGIATAVVVLGYFLARGIFETQIRVELGATEIDLISLAAGQLDRVVSAGRGLQLSVLRVVRAQDADLAQEGLLVAAGRRRGGDEQASQAKQGCGEP